MYKVREVSCGDELWGIIIWPGRSTEITVRFHSSTFHVLVQAADSHNTDLQASSRWNVSIFILVMKKKNLLGWSKTSSPTAVIKNMDLKLDSEAVL